VLRGIVDPVVTGHSPIAWASVPEDPEPLLRVVAVRYDTRCRGPIDSLGDRSRGAGIGASVGRGGSRVFGLGPVAADLLGEHFEGPSPQLRQGARCRSRAFHGGLVRQLPAKSGRVTGRGRGAFSPGEEGVARRTRVLKGEEDVSEAKEPSHRPTCGN